VKEQRALKRSTQFKRDYKRAQAQGLNTKLLVEVVRKLRNRETLPSTYFDHQLKGKWAAFRELHITSDWLLIYCISADDQLVELARCGSHANLFKR
jgi:mRNA interferase YafQ